MALEFEPNMRQLKRSRKKIRSGDVFVLQMPDHLYSFGRVIRDDLTRFGGLSVLLVYIFNTRFTSPDDFGKQRFVPANLLVAPMVVPKQMWSYGLFETVAHLPLAEGEVLPRHYFSEENLFAPPDVDDVPTILYYDEHGVRVSEPSGLEPRYIGPSGLITPSGVDYIVSVALGFDPVEIDP